MTMTRNQFLRSLAGLGAAALGVSALAACGSDDDKDPPVIGDCAANGTVVSIDGNHGHTLTVAKADVAAAANKTYDITGTSPHMHSVTITAAQFATLASTGTIQVMSTNGGTHAHAISVVCA
ncbi:MAG TPA: hypothetical protein PKU97_11925 [Kofleriaceae bacterium]|nr:hypothetical protein [Kofleriaceae bacterium]